VSTARNAGFARIEDIRSKDGTRLALFRADPQGPIRAEILVLGGLADHMGRYHHVADALAAAGYRVTGLDVRGNGLSDGRRGHVNRWSEYLEDVDAAVAAIGAPVVLLAHSTGALTALDYVREHLVEAAIVSGPLLRPKVRVPRWKKSLARVLTRAWPTLGLGNELDARDVSRHPDVIRGYDTDPLVYHIATPRGYTEMLAAADRVQEAAPSCKTPLLCMYGGDEKIVDPNAIQKLCSSWGGTVTLQPWPGLYHEIFNEPEREQVLDAAIAWLDQRFQVKLTAPT
jgi:alpha-beta hydrolase superfamily lysophospholipase